MKTLYVLRHGQAAPESQSTSDHARELTRRGQEEVRQSAQHLLARANLPTLVVSSSAARARQTADLCLTTLPQSTALLVRDDLYLAEPTSYLGVLAAGADPHTSVMVVGHNPGLEALVLVLTGRSEHLATASLVEIELPLSAWADLPGLSVDAGGAGQLVGAFRAR
jgi:phosphohistidine phosphatase